VPGRGVEIGRLVLRDTGLDARQGEELARRVAAGLAAAGTPSSEVGPRLSVTVAAGAAEDVDVLSERIVQALTRDVGAGR